MRGSKLPEMPESITSKLGELNYVSTLTRKGSDLRLKMMLNRIERLRYEERRAKQKIKQTSKKAENFISTRNKHYEEKKRLLDHQLKIENEIHAKRLQIIQENQEKKQYKEKLKNKMLSTSRKRKADQKEELHRALSNKAKELGRNSHNNLV